MAKLRHQKKNHSEATLSASSCDSPEVAHVLKGVGVVDGDGVAIHRRKVVPTVAEAALLASLHAELLDQPVTDRHCCSHVHLLQV